MSRNLKILGLALIATAILTTVAPDVRAAEFTSFNTSNSTHEGGTVSGIQTTTNLFNATGSSEFGQVTCEDVTFAGTSATGTETEAKVTPTFGKCHVILGGTTFPLDVRTNECNFKFHITGGATDEFTGTADVECPTGKVIEVEVTVAGGGTRKCLDTIGPQTGLQNFTYKNNTGASPTDLTGEAEIHNIKNTTSGGLLNCGVANGEHATGSYTGTGTVTTKNGSGVATDFTVM